MHWHIVSEVRPTELLYLGLQSRSHSHLSRREGTLCVVCETWCLLIREHSDEWGRERRYSGLIAAKFQWLFRVRHLKHGDWGLLGQLSIASRAEKWKFLTCINYMSHAPQKACWHINSAPLSRNWSWIFDHFQPQWRFRLMCRSLYICEYLVALCVSVLLGVSWVLVYSFYCIVLLDHYDYAAD